jgi:hypothetical protein
LKYNFLIYIFIFNISFSSLIEYYNYSNSSYNYTGSTEENLNSNAIYEITQHQNLLWLRTGGGISFIDFDINNKPLFFSLNSANLAEGGAPALYIDDNIIAMSGSKAIYDKGRYRPMGTGISWSTDSGVTWSYIEQSIDANPEEGLYKYVTWGNQDSIQFKAITTPIYNVSYDISVKGDFIYATSFAGGIRRFNYTQNEPIWELLPLPMDNQNYLICNEINLETYSYDPVDPPTGSDNHKAFSIFIDDYIWVGTGDGINKGIINEETNCIDWIHYNKDDGLGDRWVIGIKKQSDYNRIWAVSWDPSLNAAIPHNLSYSENMGDEWNIISFFKDIGAIVYDLNFNDNMLYASTSLGLYKTDNDNLNIWFPYNIYDPDQPLLSEVSYASNYHSIASENILLSGSPDGIFYSYNDGFSWAMHRAWNSTIESEKDEKRLSAYPNPFYIDNQNQYNDNGYVRIIFYNQNHANSELDIYNFNMDHIISLENPSFLNDEDQYLWNGRNKFNEEVANGVYFCRLILDGEVYWTKLMVINS